MYDNEGQMNQTSEIISTCCVGSPVGRLDGCPDGWPVSGWPVGLGVGFPDGCPVVGFGVGLDVVGFGVG